MHHATHRTWIPVTVLLIGAAAGGSLTPIAYGQNCIAWAERVGGGPIERRSHVMAYDAQRQVTVLFGGADGVHTHYGDTWEWDGAQWSLVAQEGPAPRSAAGMVYDSRRGRIVLYGGSGISYTRYGDTWEWDGVEWTLAADESHGPGRRYSMAMAFDEARGVTVMFGGAGPLGDTWEWDGSEWTLVAQLGPFPRSMARMVFDQRLGQCVLFGGVDDDGFEPRDTWGWDGVRWRLLTEATPAIAGSGAMAYDTQRQVAVYFGGVADQTSSGETWEWNGSNWRLVSRTGEGALRRHYSAMAYDRSRRCMVLFAGASTPGSSTLGDTWEMDSSLWVARQPEDLSLRVGAQAHFSVEADGIPVQRFQWRRNGLDLTDGGNIRGATTDTLTIRRVWPLDAALYDVVVTGACGNVVSRAAQLTVVDISLSVAPTCPGGGAITVQWANASPNGAVALLFAREEGQARVPPGYPCAGTTLGLGRNLLQVAWEGSSGTDGGRVLYSSVGPNACGGSMQLIDVTTCSVSNVATVE